MMHPDLHSLGHLAKKSDNMKLQAVLEWVGLGSVILMGMGAAVHLFKDITRPHPEPFSKHKHRELLDDLDRHHRGHEGRGR